MTKENMKLQYKEIEEELSRLSDTSMRLKIFIKSPEFRELSDLEATLAVAQHHQMEAYARTLTMRAALIGGRLQDPEGEKPARAPNDETPCPIMTPPAPEVQTGHSVKIGNTIVTEG